MVSRVADRTRTLGVSERCPHVVSGAGALLGAVLIGEVLAVLSGFGSAAEGFLIGVATSAPFIGGLIYGGYWLSRSNLPRERYEAIARWWLAGLFGTVLLIGGIMVSRRTMTVQLLVGTVRWSAAIGGTVGFILGVLRTHATQRALEAQRARRREQAVQRERDRLEEFAGIVAHDLRNPLSVATGQIELLQAETDSPQLEKASSALDRMESIIEDTLTLARAGQTVGETAPIELTELTNQCWRTNRTPDATLTIEATATVAGDEDRLRHLFENLFTNAIEHGGADVTVRVGVLEDSGGFYVEDDGPGIPESDHDRVFESGYSGSDEGTGFGLSIVKRVAKAHGWDITATESDDGGARFEVTGVNITRD